MNATWPTEIHCHDQEPRYADLPAAWNRVEELMRDD